MNLGCQLGGRGLDRSFLVRIPAITGGTPEPNLMLWKRQGTQNLPPLHT